MKIKAALLTIITCCSLASAQGDYCFEETEQVGAVNEDAWIVTERSDKEILEELLAESRQLKVVGIKYCVSDTGYLENIEIRIGGDGLDRVAPLTMMGLSLPSNHECEEIEVEDNFAQKVEYVEIFEMGGLGVCSVRFGGAQLRGRYQYGAWDSNPWMTQELIVIPGGN